MSLDGLSPALAADTLALHERFRKARPFRHLVLEEFLDPDFCRDLIGEFPGFDKDKALNEYGEVGGKAVHSELAELGLAYARFDALMQAPKFLSWLSEATGIPGLLYDPEYVGGGTHQNNHGQDLDPHVDFNYHTNNRWHRRLNLILFLNDRWEEDWGGCLQLHRDPWLPVEEDESATVVPLSNRAVIFETTESSWHGFPRILLPEAERDLSRRSLAVYFYTEERPADQTAPGHGTYYVPRPLPGGIAEGEPLTASQIREVEDLIDRRNRQLKFFWQRERELRRELDSLGNEVHPFQVEIRRLQMRERELEQQLERTSNSASMRLGRALTWPFRAVRRVFGGRD